MRKLFATASYSKDAHEECFDINHGIIDDSFVTAFWDEDIQKMKALNIGETLNLSDKGGFFFVTRIA